ncbi:ATP-binding protein [Actinacidiphila reveromycinica]|nr:ATP-binding protein [Streptomyces sp. SN-593]
MLAALLVCAAIVLAAAAPGVALAAGDLSSAQDRVDAARLASLATALAADLADERDDLAVSVAAGRPAAPTADQQRTDRRLAEATGGHLSADLRTALGTLTAVRRSARASSSAPAAVAAYQPLVDAVGRAVGPVTAPLERATAAAAVQRGLLVAGLTATGTQRGLVADAQAARLQERAALAEFHAAAPVGVRTDYDQTVTGADTAEADRDLDQLLGGTELTPADRELGAGKVATALAARLSLMRGVASSAAADEAAGADAHRGHEVTVLELRAALAALCLILLVAVLVTLFRTLTRPLAALHRWSRTSPDSGQGSEVIGTDEFAAVARRVNALTHQAQGLRTRAAELDAEHAEAAAAHTALAAAHTALTSEHSALTSEHSALATDHRAVLAAGAELARTRDDLMRSREEIAEQLNRATARQATQVVHVNLALRTLGLIERQLALIEGMEEHEQEPDRLATLFRLDHLATRMRRNSENMLVLTGTEHSHGATARPVPLIDVARAALSEVERYERVRILAMPEGEVAGRAADDVSHLVAELLDNATAFSAPEAEVHLSGWVTEGGEVMVAVEDAGIGVPAERIDRLNALLLDPDPPAPGAAAGLGLYVVARLAHRHGVRVQLRPHANGGTSAVVVLPRLLVPGVDPLARVLPGRREGAHAPAYGTSAQAPAPGMPYGADAELPPADRVLGGEPVLGAAAGVPGTAEQPGPAAVVPLVPAQQAAVAPEPLVLGKPLGGQPSAGHGAHATPDTAGPEAGALPAAEPAPGARPPLARRLRPQPESESGTQPPHQPQPAPEPPLAPEPASALGQFPQSASEPASVLRQFPQPASAHAPASASAPVPASAPRPRQAQPAAESVRAPRSEPASALRQFPQPAAESVVPGPLAAPPAAQGPSARAQPAAAAAPAAPPPPARRPLARPGGAAPRPGQQGTGAPRSVHPADAPAEPRVRVERLDVPPAPMSPSAGSGMQMQPLKAETANAPAYAPEPPSAAGAPMAGQASAPVPSAEHARAAYAPRHAADAPPAPPAADGALPRRVRKASGIRHAAQDGRRRTEPLDAQGLRRKLAGLQRGLRDGRRDAALEAGGAAAKTSAAPSATAASPGDTVEEATR